MNIKIKVLTTEYVSFQKEMIYIALWDPPHQPPRPRSVLDSPEVIAYYDNWGQPDDVGFVAEDDGKPIGFIQTRIKSCVTANYSDYPELGVAVLPEYRGRGISKLLFSKIISTLKNKYKGIRLGVHPENENAINLYKKYGFEFYAKPEGKYPQMVLRFDKTGQGA